MLTVTAVTLNMYLTVVLVAASIALLCYIVGTRRQKLKVFANMGVNGPEPNVLFGNLHEFAKKKMFEAYADWRQTFGKTYGVYEGSAPVLVTSDVNILREVYVKKFSQFFGRRLFPIQPEPDTGADKDVHILFSRGHRWKRLRTTISPSFSNVKMKQMFPLMKVCIDHTVDVACAAKAKAGEEFDIHAVMQGMTLDVIASCALGLSPVFQRSKDDPVLKRCRRLFDDFAKKPWLIVLGALFPEGRNFWWKVCKFIASYTYDDIDWLYTSLSTVIEGRRQQSAAGQPPARVDLLQLLLDAEVGGGSSGGSSNICGAALGSSLAMTEGDDREGNAIWCVTNNNNLACGYEPAVAASQDADTSILRCDATSAPTAVTAPARPRHLSLTQPAPADCPAALTKGKLSMDEVIANSVVFLIGGYETTSNLISYVAYEMAMHADCQAKLQRELDDALAAEQDGFAYETITQLPYLEMVVREALRMYPMGMMLTGRVCMDDVEVCGLQIPKGMTIQPDVWSLHHDTEHWGESPHEFNPDRFLPECIAERDPMAFLPFGAGPKNCVGMRFALVECKLAIARLLSKYTVMTTPRTRLELMDGAALNPKNGITIKLVERD